jgi:hypothetical protein
MVVEDAVVAVDYVGRWSRLVARQFVVWLGVPPNKDWLLEPCDEESDR